MPHSTPDLESSPAIPRLPPGARTTCLPRLIPGPPPRLILSPEARYAEQRPLGEGGVGEVVLVEDRDIQRSVALKRLKGGTADLDSVSRFIDEIKVVGQLEHPGIVPIHDVGVDERGRPFFIMKYLEGETLEAVIEGLSTGKPGYAERFTHEHRAQIFLQVLHAVRFAHERGYIHRDLKPGNIMVGRYGEVVVMDWGLAKPVSAEGPTSPPKGQVIPREALPSLDLDARATLGEGAAQTMLAPGPPPDAATATTDPGGRMSTTRIGALVGTPAYMAPEQVRGENDRLDQRCDIYSLCALFFELLTLEHYLKPKANINGLLWGVMYEEPIGALGLHHKYGVPPELAWFVVPGLAKDPAGRYQSVGQMIDRLQSILDGQITPQCPCTTLKRAGHEYADFINKHPNLAVATAILTTACTGYGLTRLVLDLVGALR